MENTENADQNSAQAQGSGESSGNSSGNSASEIRDAEFREYPEEERFEAKRRYAHARGIDNSDGNTGNERASAALDKNRGYSRSGQAESVEPKNNMYTQPTILPVPISGFGFGGYGAAAAPVAPAVGYGNDYGSFAVLQALNNIHGDVKDAECSVKDSIMVSNSQRQTAELANLTRVCDVEKEAIKAGFESRLEAKETKADLLARIEECCCDMKLMNVETRNFITEKFCDLERRTDKDFASIKEREDAREIANLRLALTKCETLENNTGLASSIINALKSTGVIK